MSTGIYRLVFKPITGTFELEKRQKLAGGLGGATVVSGVLTLPEGVQLEVTEGFAAIGDGEVTIDEGSDILVLP